MRPRLISVKENISFKITTARLVSLEGQAKGKVEEEMILLTSAVSGARDQV